MIHDIERVRLTSGERGGATKQNSTNPSLPGLRGAGSQDKQSGSECIRYRHRGCLKRSIAFLLGMSSSAQESRAAAQAGSTQRKWVCVGKYCAGEHCPAALAEEIEDFRCSSEVPTLYLSPSSPTRQMEILSLSSRN